MTDKSRTYLINCPENDYEDLISFIIQHDITLGTMTVKSYLAGSGATEAITSVIVTIYANEDEMLLIRTAFSIEVLQ